MVVPYVQQTSLTTSLHGLSFQYSCRYPGRGTTAYFQTAAVEAIAVTRKDVSEACSQASSDAPLQEAASGPRRSKRQKRTPSSWRGRGVCGGQGVRQAAQPNPPEPGGDVNATWALEALAALAIKVPDLPLLYNTGGETGAKLPATG